MKLLLVIAAVIALSAAAPQGANPRDATIVEQTNDNIGVGPWNWSFRTSDGTARQESGTINNAGTENEAIAVRGSITWITPDGQTHTLNYVADENGFQPEGSDIPAGRK
ncbi:endocuticle structural protein SgAbd-6 [Anabrus simplex]|uniref:endocuticle structural protein SgAbd-6 n=1 Tax=Anabrus simplex TaxID=316456 RepID=UPI0034DCC8C9